MRGLSTNWVSLGSKPERPNKKEVNRMGCTKINIQRPDISSTWITPATESTLLPQPLPWVCWHAARTLGPTGAAERASELDAFPVRTEEAVRPFQRPMPQTLVCVLFIGRRLTRLIRSAASGETCGGIVKSTRAIRRCVALVPLSSSKGGTPQRNSYARTPNAHRSTLSLWARCSTISGGR